MNNRLKFQCREADNKVYREMQSVYANCMVKDKATASGCFRVYVEEKWRVQLSKLLVLFHHITDAN